MAKRQLSPTIKQDVSNFNAYSFSQKIQMIPLEKVLPNDKNFYRIEDEEVILLMEDIESQGVKHNLVVKSNGNGTYTIISGHKRREAVRRLVEEKGYANTLPCYVENYSSEDEEMQALIMLNVTNRKLNDSELMRGYEELRAIFERQKADKQVKGRIRELVAQALNISTGQVSKLDNIRNNAIEKVKNLVDSGDLSIFAASEIATLTEPEQNEFLKSKSEIKISDIQNKKRANVGTNVNSSNGEKCANVGTNINSSNGEKCVINGTNINFSSGEKCVINDTNINSSNGEKCANVGTNINSSNGEKCVINDTNINSSNGEKCATNGTNIKFSKEQIRHALELLFYNNEEITTIIKCLEKNTR